MMDPETEMNASELQDEVDKLSNNLDWRKRHYPIWKYQHLVAENEMWRTEVLRLMDEGGDEWTDIKPKTSPKRVARRVSLWLWQWSHT